MNGQTLVSISALEHWSYCPRQCGLIHLESVWDENVFTVRGTAVHERADQAVTRQERGVRIERALPLWSEAHGLVGKADVVEFHNTTRLPSSSPSVVPVEYKSGGPSHAKHAALQLCAQALCLEEMLGTHIDHGFLYFAKTRERKKVLVDESLRARTLEAVARTREMLDGTELPPPVNDNRCPQCSLIDACMPGVVVKAARRSHSMFHPRPEQELP